MIDILVRDAVAEAQRVAARATEQYIAKNGEWDACGFASVRVYEKGSTRIGRALLKNGFRKCYSGGLELWNPSGSYTQAITAKEVGAEAAAEVLREVLGVKAYAWSRMD